MHSRCAPRLKSEAEAARKGGGTPKIVVEAITARELFSGGGSAACAFFFNEVRSDAAAHALFCNEARSGAVAGRPPGGPPDKNWRNPLYQFFPNLLHYSIAQHIKGHLLTFKYERQHKIEGAMKGCTV